MKNQYGKRLKVSAKRDLNYKSKIIRFTLIALFSTFVFLSCEKENVKPTRGFQAEPGNGTTNQSTSQTSQTGGG